jgi:transposase
MQAASGNSSDQTAFSEIISKHIESFQTAIKNRYLVGDSALYTPNSIKSLNAVNALLITRVSAKINLTQEVIEKSFLNEMTDLEEGYLGKE